MLAYEKNFIPTDEFHLEKFKGYTLGIDENARYIIGIEQDPYLHCHCYIETENEKFYQKFRQNYIISRWSLRGRAVAGHSRQYGKVDAIKDHAKMKAYTLKQGNYLTNFSDKEIAELEEIAFKKQDSIRNLNYKEGCLAFVEQNYGNGIHSSFKIKSLIIEYLTKSSQNVTRSKVTTLYFYICQFSQADNLKLNFNEITRELFS